VKFQTFRAQRIVTRASPKAEYQLKTTASNESQFDMLKKLELNENTFGRIAEECARVGIGFLSTPYSVEDVDLLESIQTPAYKIASAMAVERLLLERVARTGKPVLLSTGMCTMEEVVTAVDILAGSGCEELLIFQCTTDYPSRLQEANLNVIPEFQEKFRIPIGYSDHAQGLLATTVAVALGACAIERHFTLDRNLPGPDHQASSDPEEFRLLVETVRAVETALGSAEKRPTEREAANRMHMRRGIVAGRQLLKGHVLELKDLGFKRPLQGVRPDRYKDVIGRRLIHDLDEDEPISWGDLE
jgi:N-acetylneuraminate synthase/N,N'-diacetyllegionaminate synthase